MYIDFVKLGAYIRNARTQQGKTLEEMASQTGCSAEFLQNLEKGLRKPELEVFFKLISALNLSGDELLANVAGA